MISIAPYRKTAASLIGSVLTWVGVAYIPDGHINRAEWYTLSIAVAGVLGVYSVTNAAKMPKVARDSGKTPPAPAPVERERVPVFQDPPAPIVGSAPAPPVVSTVAAVRRHRAAAPRSEAPNA